VEDHRARGGADGREESEGNTGKAAGDDENDAEGNLRR
jgi:hypothetical protein